MAQGNPSDFIVVTTNNLDKAKNEKKLMLKSDYSQKFKDIN